MKINHLAIGLLIPLVVTGCNLVRARGGADEPSSKAGTSAATSSLSLCQEGLIDDGEDGDGDIIAEAGRDGSWSVDANPGSEAEPKGGYLMKKGGANGTALTAWMIGTVKGKKDEGYVELGAELKGSGSYDASRFAGVRFFARGKGSVSFGISDVNTTQEGGRCKEVADDPHECNNSHAVKLNLTEDWKEYRFVWSDLKQDPEWGHQAKFEPNAIYKLVWQSSHGSVELYVDEVAFIGCPAGSKPLETAKPEAAPSPAPAASSAAPAPSASASAAPAGK